LRSSKERQRQRGWTREDANDLKMNNVDRRAESPMPPTAAISKQQSANEMRMDGEGAEGCGCVGGGQRTIKGREEGWRIVKRRREGHRDRRGRGALYHRPSQVAALCGCGSII